MRQRRSILRFAYCLLIAFVFILFPILNSIQPGSGVAAADGISQGFTFVPQVTQVSFQTLQPFSIATRIVASGPVDLGQGAFFSPTYARVDCGEIEDETCFELCYAGKCIIYGGSDDRVRRFIEKVDAREQGIVALEILRAEKGGVISDAIGQCVGSGVKAGLAYLAVVGITAPEPTITKILGVIAAGGTIILCGGDIYSALHVESLKQEIVEETIIDDSREAIFEFESLQQTQP